jgi:hypothetical protein
MTFTRIYGAERDLGLARRLAYKAAAHRVCRRGSDAAVLPWYRNRINEVYERRG